jgi:hypothetical protein
MEQIAFARGEEFLLNGNVTRNALPVDLTAGGVRLALYAKRKASDDDDAGAIRKDLANLPAVQLYGGITGQVSGAYTVTIYDTDTLGFTVTELLSFSVWLEELDGSRTLLRHGIFKVLMT